MLVMIAVETEKIAEAVLRKRIHRSRQILGENDISSFQLHPFSLRQHVCHLPLAKTGIIRRSQQQPTNHYIHNRKLAVRCLARSFLVTFQQSS